MIFTKKFDQINTSNVGIAGGKAASLGELTKVGFPVPPGFVILAATFDQGIPSEAEHEILQQFKNLNSEFVAVRSSATAEDGIKHAWAGQLESYLNVTEEHLIQKIKECANSINNPHAISYRDHNNLQNEKITVAVIVQRMVQAESAGIMFTAHPVTNDTNQIVIEAGFGLGEAIVSGQTIPDNYIVTKNPLAIAQTQLMNKTGKQALTQQQILKLAAIALKIESHFGFPCDIEWALEKEKFYIVQSRPITTL